MRADEIRAPLVREFGGAVDGDTVRGEGWSVRFVPGEPAGIGRMRVPVLFLEVEGEREEEAARFLRHRTMRGGG